jgi:hypothetical protein
MIHMDYLWIIFAITYNFYLFDDVFANYINFKHGNEYKYKFHLDTKVKDLGRFRIDAKVRM